MSRSHREHESADLTSVDRLAERVLLVGWDGTDFSVLRLLLAAGRLPHLSRLISDGASIELVVPRPDLAPAAWTTLATGKRPHEHGILHAFAPSADGASLQPIMRHSRQCGAMWSAMHRAGRRTHVVGWPVTHPVEPLSGISVSDRFAAPVAGLSLSFSDGPTVLPADAEPNLRSRRVSPTQLEEIAVAQLLPHSASSLPQYSQLESMCRAILAEAATLFRAFRWCLGGPAWDFSACVFPGIRRCHELAIWMQNASPAAAEFSERLLVGCYEHHDLLLGQLVDQVGEHTHVIAVSLSGGGATANEISDAIDAPLRTSSPSRKMGMAVVHGPKVRHATIPLQGNLLDVAPTILAMLDVPYGKDMPGQPRLDCFEAVLKPKTVDTWETLGIDPCAYGQRTSGRIADVQSVVDSDQHQSVAHLFALGYVDPHDTAARERADQCRRIGELNRLTSLLDSGLISQAIARLEVATIADPDWYAGRMKLAEAYYRANQLELARREIDWLMCRGMEQPQLFFLSAVIAFADRHYELALDELRCAGRAGIVLFGARALEGDIQLRKRDFAAAEAAFRASITCDGPTLQSLDGLAAVNLHLGRYEEAATNALDALAKEMRFGRAHYHLAVALCQLGRPHEARRALESWATVDPQSAAPFRWLARVCELKLDDRTQAAVYNAQGREVVRRRRKLVKSMRADDTLAPSSSR